jgi:hypothetical protein
MIDKPGIVTGKSDRQKNHYGKKKWPGDRDDPA